MGIGSIVFIDTNEDLNDATILSFPSFPITLHSDLVFYGERGQPVSRPKCERIQSNAPVIHNNALHHTTIKEK